MFTHARPRRSRIGAAARRGAAVCALTGLFTAPAAAEWRRLDTPSFIVIGDVSARQLRDAAARFEGFRETLSRVISQRATATAVPTVVIVFPHDRAFTPYKPQYEGKPVDAAGVFYGGADVNYIALVHGSGPDSMRIIFHEYAHLVVSNLTMNLPVWLNEGLAEFYSTYELGRGGREAVIGGAIESHVHLLRETTLIPLDRLTAVDHDSPLYNEGNRRSVFYAQAWALTHMLMLGDPPRTKELTTYMRHLAQGEPGADAWRQAFGGATIDRELGTHVRRQAFRAFAFRFADQVDAFEAEPRVIPQADVSAFLAGLRLRQGRMEDALAQVSAALASDDRHPHASVMKARLDMEAGDPKAAARRLVPAGAFDDWFAAYLAGVTLTDATERGRTAGPDQLAAARAYFDAVGRAREVPNALANRAMLDLFSPDGPNAGSRAAIERARAMAPGRHEYVLIHAGVEAEMGDVALARKMLAPLLAPGFPEAVRETARQWLANIVQREAGRQQSGAAATTTQAAGGRRADKPADDVIPIYRTVGTDEHRVEGVLERIACPASPPATFYVRTAEGAQEFHAQKLSDVEFIAYRDDLTGGVACGPLDKPMRVFLTWKNGPRPGERRVVAVEFLR